MTTFFFSYAHSDNNEYLRSFFEDLQARIDAGSGEQGSGFIDQTGLENGDLWEEKLESALGHSRVFVAAVSPTYWTRPYCGKEWAAFMDRVKRYEAVLGRGLATRTQPQNLVVPILWVRPFKAVPIPQEVTKRQFGSGNPDSTVNRRDVFSLVRNKASYATEYDELLDTLAQRVFALASDHAGIDALAGVPPLATLKSVFDSPVPGSAPALAPTLPSPSRVHFVFGAPSPAQARTAGRQDVASYGASGGADWCPYSPSQRTIGALSQSVTSSPQVNMLSLEMPLGPDLAQRVRHCEKEKQVVVVLLDRWAALVPEHSQTLQDFDRESFVNCGVLVPDNPTDGESQAHAEQLNAGLKAALFRRLRSGNPIYLRTGITSDAEFCKHLQDTLTHLRADVVAASEAAHPVPAGGGISVISASGN